MFMHQKIARSERQAVFWDKTGIFKTIFRMKLAVDSAFVAAKVFGSDKHKVMNLKPDGEMRGILKLVMHIAAKVRCMPAHTKRFQRTQDATWVEFPGMVGVINIPIGSENIVRDHCLYSIQILLFNLKNGISGNPPGRSIGGVRDKSAPTRSVLFCQSIVIARLSWQENRSRNIVCQYRYSVKSPRRSRVA